MAKVERFEDLICWQKARELVNLICSVSTDAALSKALLEEGSGVHPE